MNLYEYVVVHRPKDKDPKLVSEGKFFAPNLEKARQVAVATLSEKWSKLICELEVLVRPFS